MKLRELLEADSELTHNVTQTAVRPIVLSSRIRLARNLEGHSFPRWAKKDDQLAVLSECQEALHSGKNTRKYSYLSMGSLNEGEREALIERHLISKELAEAEDDAAVFISKDQACAIMVNEEDHLRIQVMRRGLQLKRIWKAISAIDDELEEFLDYAFSEKLGYLTACPTNLGTALRASAMMHLPGLVLQGHMEKVVRGVAQLGITVRGIYGEGSDASGSIFQISNQQTLGESELEIIERLQAVLKTIIEQEENARACLLEDRKEEIEDKIGRSYGILKYGYEVNSAEGLNLLSIMRLGIDLGAFEAKHRNTVDELLIRCQPRHLQVLYKEGSSPETRDILRATILRQAVAKIPEPKMSAL